MAFKRGNGLRPHHKVIAYSDEDAVLLEQYIDSHLSVTGVKQPEATAIYVLFHNALMAWKEHHQSLAMVGLLALCLV